MQIVFTFLFVFIAEIFYSCKIRLILLRYYIYAHVLRPIFNLTVHELLVWIYNRI